MFVAEARVGDCNLCGDSCLIAMPDIHVTMAGHAQSIEEHCASLHEGKLTPLFVDPLGRGFYCQCKSRSLVSRTIDLAVTHALLREQQGKTPLLKNQERG